MPCSRCSCCRRSRPRRWRARNSALVGQMVMQGASSQWLQRITEKFRLTLGNVPVSMYFHPGAVHAEGHVVLALARDRAGVTADAAVAIEQEPEPCHETLLSLSNKNPSRAIRRCCRFQRPRGTGGAHRRTAAPPDGRRCPQGRAAGVAVARLKVAEAVGRRCAGRGPRGRSPPRSGQIPSGPDPARRELAPPRLQARRRRRTDSGPWPRKSRDGPAPSCARHGRPRPPHRCRRAPPQRRPASGRGSRGPQAQASQQVVISGHMAVQRGLTDTESIGHAGEGQLVEPLRVGNLGRGGYHPFGVQGAPGQGVPLLSTTIVLLVHRCRQRYRPRESCADVKLAGIAQPL